MIGLALLALTLSAQDGRAGVFVALDLDPGVSGIQDSVLVEPGGTVTAELIVTVDSGGLSSYAVSAEFDTGELDLAGSPAATENLPAGFDANITPGVENETEDAGGGLGQVLTFEAVAFALGPASTQFTAGTIQFEAPAPADGGAFDLESGAFNLRVDGAFDNSGLAVTLSFGGGFVNALICGDGFAEGPEQCDDSNSSGLDGCSQTCRTEYSYTFSGTAEGGSVDLVIDGIAVTFLTSAGQTSSQVAAEAANAVNANGSLATLGAVATAVGDELVVAGDIQSVSITDPGLVVPVPVGEWTGTILFLFFSLFAMRFLRSADHGCTAE